MMRTTLLLAAASAVAALDSNSYGQPSPVISWSTTADLFDNCCTVVVDEVPVDEVASHFAFSKDVAAPAAAVVFAFDSLATVDMPRLVAEGSDFVATAVAEAASSKVAPYTYGAGGSVADFVADLPALFGVEGTPALYVRSEDSVTAALDASGAFHTEVVSNGDLAATLGSSKGPVFLYVAVPSDLDAEATNAHLNTTLAAVRELVSGDVIAFATTTQYEQLSGVSRKASARQLEQAATVALSQVRITPNIILALMTGVVLFFFLYSGFSSMMTIRPNDQFWIKTEVPLGAKVEH